MKSARSFWVFLILGILLRSVALNQPLVDAHLLRQCQTAAATESLIGQPGFPLAAKIPWLGDLDAHFILELPLYNYLVMAVHWFTGNLDLSGKVTSIVLWAFSFVLLQAIWRRMLGGAKTFWANLLFVIAPLEVFYGQAFMPEMLVQALAFAFVVLVLRHDEKPGLGRWIALTSVGAVGLLVKLPEFAHLYLLLAAVAFRHGWRTLVMPRTIIAGLLTVAALKAWSGYVDSINSAYLPEWNSGEALRGFIGPLGSRFQARPWMMLAGYLGAFVFSGPAALAAAMGLWTFIRTRSRGLLGVWLVSIALFYLIWFGNAGSSQSYYNLPAVAPLCALFGIGIEALLALGWVAKMRAVAIPIIALLVVVPPIPVWFYLFKQDRQIFEAAQWVRDHSGPGEVILFRPNHRFDMVDYPYNPVPAYYSGRPAFVWTGGTPEKIRGLAMERAKVAVVTSPQPAPSGLAGAFARFRGAAVPKAESDDWLTGAGFEVVESDGRFTAYRRKESR